MKRKKIFITPVNDGESVEIRNLLETCGILLFITNQSWGASWTKLEEEVVLKVEKFLEKNPGAQVYGVELSEKARWNAINIDHHCYKDDDRSNPKSSLEQVAEVLGVSLNRYQILVSENDKGYIPAMKAFGASNEEISQIRAQDRLAQGVTAEDENQARLDIQSTQWQEKKVLITCPKRANSAHTDFLFGQYDECLKIDEVSDKWMYLGPRHHQFFELTKEAEGARWKGGAPESGFSGVEKPIQKLQDEIIKFFWE